MTLNGFAPAAGSQTYHHTEGKVRSLREVDQGLQKAIEDDDPRDGFLAYGCVKAILDTEPEKQLSYLRKFQRGDEMTLTREWSHAGRYEELEVRRSEMGTVVAEFSTLEDGKYRLFKADQATATSLLESMNAEFQERWNLA